MGQAGFRGTSGGLRGLRPLDREALSHRNRDALFAFTPHGATLTRVPPAVHRTMVRVARAKTDHTRRRPGATVVRRVVPLPQPPAVIVASM